MPAIAGFIVLVLVALWFSGEFDTNEKPVTKPKTQVFDYSIKPKKPIIDESTLLD